MNLIGACNSIAMNENDSSYAFIKRNILIGTKNVAKIIFYVLLCKHNPKT